MADFRFEALSTRSFEQLIQSLALVTLSPGVTPFGDGPDGGREAIFEGPVDYGTDGAPWNGYGVIQAKFLQRPLGTGHDGDWALRQLASELRDYEKAGSRRRVPEYYIYATNATLSGVQAVGTKDKVFARLKDFAKRHGLKGFDVWDYDKLRALLEGQADVRSSYDAWITPGDVLAKVIARLDGMQPDFDKLMVRLLLVNCWTTSTHGWSRRATAHSPKCPLRACSWTSPTQPHPTMMTMSRGKVGREAWYLRSWRQPARASTPGATSRRLIR